MGHRLCLKKFTQIVSRETVNSSSGGITVCTLYKQYIFSLNKIGLYAYYITISECRFNRVLTHMF
jgi:hypothetical protein